MRDNIKKREHRMSAARFNLTLHPSLTLSYDTDFTIDANTFLGKGTSSAVYLGDYNKVAWGTPAAIKVIGPSKHRETQVSAECNFFSTLITHLSAHPEDKEASSRIIKLFGCDLNATIESEIYPVFVYEFISTGDLGDWLFPED